MQWNKGREFGNTSKTDVGTMSAGAFDIFLSNI